MSSPTPLVAPTPSSPLFPRIAPSPSPTALDLAAAVFLEGVTAQYLATDTFPLMEGHRCLIHAGARFPLAAAADAQNALEGGHTTGKVLLEH